MSSARIPLYFNKLLLCRQTFCGKDALDQLAEFALLGRSKELIEAPAQENKISGSPGLSSALPSADQQAPGPCSSNFEPDESSAKRMAKQPGAAPTTELACLISLKSWQQDLLSQGLQARVLPV